MLFFRIQSSVRIFSGRRRAGIRDALSQSGVKEAQWSLVNELEAAVDAMTHIPWTGKR